ncbi:MAG TPA: GGDEF domain-containing protein [Tepidisphaeraceae bacterium]|nr:GGDEF domain-containing protein [Tepidisphaeraceae bacterium]
MAARESSRILLVGESTEPMRSALTSAAPRSEIITTPTVFDAIAELSANEFQAVFFPAEPIERRPESAVETLRSVAGDARLVLFGHPTLEPISRKMLGFGCDDYVVTPAEPAELSQILSQKSERAKIQENQVVKVQPATESSFTLPSASFDSTIFLDALLHHPTDAPVAAAAQLNRSLSPMRLSLLDRADSPPPAADGFVAFSQPVDRNRPDSPTLYLQVPRSRDEAETRKLLDQLAVGFAKLSDLQRRHLQMQKLATTDELTGLANARWFRHFLGTVMESARKRKSPVTLLLYDIDDFKKYNDQYGHGVGDEILKQTAQLMRRCVREHDLVARIGGDEFAVVFWEKQGPRTVRDPHAAPPSTPGRPPQTPQIMCKRFQTLLAKHAFSALGPGGQGTLTISGGLATFPWDGRNPEELIEAADKALMFGAKRSGKNSIALVGEDGK